MKKTFFIVLAFITFSAFGQNSEFLKVTSYTLDNGLTVWINEDHTTPTAYGAVVVRAGAKDCPGTGIAHYFEHMAFKGTDKIGTLNYEQEKPYLDSIAFMYDKLARTSDNKERLDIQKQINRLNIKAAEYVIPNEFQTLTTACGGANLNAYTSQDKTVFHSDFRPQYFEQWAEINSERLIHPVFRLFQSELETVYEEKNMYSDNIWRSAYETMDASFFAGTPYQYTVIGTTENLKNPQLNKMVEFYEKFYVGCNMGLIISGDINTESITPIIERTFGRITKGSQVQREEIYTVSTNGREEKEVLVNMPVVKAEVIYYKAPLPEDPDSKVMDIIRFMMQNGNGTGLLDKLVVDRKLMTAWVEDNSYQSVGAVDFFIIPKLFGQSLKSAESYVLKAINDIKNGNYDKSFLEACKQSYKKSVLARMEDKEDLVTHFMASVMSQKRSWDDELSRIEAISKITKDDISRVAGKYLSNDCMVFIKKTGKSVKDNLKKPPYEKVIPAGKDSTSAYARELMKELSIVSPSIPEIDFNQAVDTVQLSELVRIYTTKNPINNVFDLEIRFLDGTFMNPAYEHMASYINCLGTHEMTYNELNGKLQQIGGHVSVSAKANTVALHISGFDENIEETVKIACSILRDIKSDSKKLNIIKNEDISNLHISKKDISTIAQALYCKAAYGKCSPFYQDKGKLTDEFLIELWKEVQKKQTDILYTGNVSKDKVAKIIKENVNLESVTENANVPKEKTFITYPKSQVLFIDKADAAQTIIIAYIPTDILPDRKTRVLANIYQTYLGGGMSSLMFQELREFRSMAYLAGSALYIPSWKCRNEQGGYIIAKIGTQNDKAVDAMQVLDSLIENLPIIPSKLEDKKDEVINDLFYNYPSFRKMASHVEFELLNGVNYDVSAKEAQIVENITPEDLKNFSKTYFENRPIIWCVVGNSRKIDMKGLETFGPITKMKVGEVIR